MDLQERVARLEEQNRELQSQLAELRRALVCDGTGGHTIEVRRVVLADDAGETKWQVTVDQKDRLTRGGSTLVFSNAQGREGFKEVATLSSAQGFHHDVRFRVGDDQHGAGLAVDTGGVDKSNPLPQVVLEQSGVRRIHLGLRQLWPQLLMEDQDGAKIELQFDNDGSPHLRVRDKTDQLIFEVPQGSQDGAQSAVASGSGTRPVKTVILLRHADIDTSVTVLDTSPLTAAGQARAQALAHALGNAGVTAIFTSPALRTQQTIEPLAARLGRQFRPLPSPTQTIQQALSSQAGAVVLIAGHSGTVPQMITALGAPFSQSAVQGHDDLFVVTVIEPGKASLVRLKYGVQTT